MAEIIWDSELGPSWPDDWEHTTVHAQFVAVTGDGADTDRLPDIAPSGNGEVVFTPSLRTVRYVGADGPYVVSLKQYRAVVDSEGYLCTPDQYGNPGERGIVLPSTDAEVLEPRGEDDNAFTWRVDFDIPAVTHRSDHIAVPVDGPYNLVDLLSPERAAGVVHIIDRVSARDAIQAAQEATAARDLVLPARDETLTARDEVLAHGAPVIDTSVGTRVFVGNTMIFGDTGWRDMAGSLWDSWEAVSVSLLSLELRRETNTVHLVGRIAYTGADGTHEKSSGVAFLSLPSGFIPASTRGTLGVAGYYAAATHSGSRDSGYLYVTGTTLYIQFPTRNENWFPGQAVGFNVSWSTKADWPDSLPDTPA